MAAKVLIINEEKLDITGISSKLKEFHCSLLVARSIEDSIRIIGMQTIDVVFLSLPQNTQGRSLEWFFDFFSVLRQLCGVIPIIGLVKVELKKHDILPINLANIDDIICINIDPHDLMRRVRTLVKIKNRFDNKLLSNMYLGEYVNSKIIAFFYNNVDFLNKEILKDSEIVTFKNWPVIDNLNDADLFIININHPQANECCANLRLREANKYKPIVLTFDKNTPKDKIKQSVELDVGFTDIINSEFNSIANTCRLNSFIKYKKKYEAFLNKLEKSLYLSVIDSTTEVYNRAFFDDYLKNQILQSSNCAILMLDVDHFKAINDKFGHAFADLVLKHISSMIKKYTRSSDIVARYGGDEFVIIMYDINKQIVENVALRIQQKICDSCFDNINCTVSIGVCCVLRGENTSIQDAISIADKFMYVAKNNGGNRVQICA
jgi:diguanylate cyclase (GGDEF)-like protein